jgi:hypothetical protein
LVREINSTFAALVTIWDFSGLTFANYNISLSLLLCYISYYTALFYTMMMNNNNTNNERKDDTILPEELQLPGLDGVAYGSTRAVPTLPHPHIYGKLVQAVTGIKLRNYINQKQRIFTTNIGFVLYVA